MIHTLISNMHNLDLFAPLVWDAEERTRANHHFDSRPAQSVITCLCLVCAGDKHQHYTVKVQVGKIMHGYILSMEEATFRKLIRVNRSNKRVFFSSHIPDMLHVPY